MLNSFVNDGTMLFSVPFSILAETPSGPLALDVCLTASHGDSSGMFSLEVDIVISLHKIMLLFSPLQSQIR